ncbi:MAG: hypothetical protein K6G22_02995 [Lachnospiraceae bacterium]|nr:hypothetical protein [Lachnospiraceae bacterium]
MSTTEERIARIHDRAKEIKNEKDLRLMRIGTAVTTVLGVFLIALIGFASRGDGTSPGVVSDAGYAGASMFSSQTGGYILVALVAFMFGAVLTALIRAYQQKNKGQDNKTSD